MNSLFLILSKRRYFAPVWIFSSINIIISTWVLYVPAVKEKLGLDDAQLGLALFGFSFGLLSIIPFSSTILKRVGLGKTTFISVSLMALLMCFPVVATSYGALITFLFFAGIFTSLTDIGMNAMVSEIEQEDNANFMSAAHGFFSLGGVLGAGVGSLLLGYFAYAWQHSLTAAIFVILTNLLLVGSYFGRQTKEAERSKEGKFDLSLIKPLLGLTVLAFIIMGSEGAIEHWSKLYMLDVVQIDSDRLAGFGFVAFSTTMTIGRFLGDGISDRFGPLKIIIGGTLIAACGFGLALGATYSLALIGFGLVGCGFSVIIPELFRLAGKAPGVSSAEGISVVAGLGYVGFLASPALLGFLSDLSSLKLSFATLLAGSLVSCAVAFYLKQKRKYQ